MTIYDDIQRYTENARLQLLAKLAERYPGGKLGKFVRFTNSGKRVFEVDGKKVIATPVSNTALSEYSVVIIDEAASAEWQEKKKKRKDRNKVKKKGLTARQQRSRPNRLKVFEDDGPAGNYLVKYTTVDPGKLPTGYRYNFIRGDVENGGSGSLSQTVPKDNWNPLGDPSKIINILASYIVAQDLGGGDVSATADCEVFTIEVAPNNTFERSLFGGYSTGYTTKSISLNTVIGGLDFIEARFDSFSFVVNDQQTFYYSYEGNLYEFTPAQYFNELIYTVGSFRKWIADGIVFETYKVATVDLSVLLDGSVQPPEPISEPVGNFLPGILIGQLKYYFLHLRLDLSDGSIQVRITDASNGVTSYFASASESNGSFSPEGRILRPPFSLNNAFNAPADYSVIAADAFEDDWISLFDSIFKSAEGFSDRNAIASFCRGEPSSENIDEFKNAASIEFSYPAGIFTSSFPLANDRRNDKTFLGFPVEDYPSREDIYSFKDKRFYNVVTSTTEGGKAIDFFSSVDDINLYLLDNTKDGYTVESTTKLTNEILEENGLEFEEEPVVIIRNVVGGDFARELKAEKVWMPKFELNLPTKEIGNQLSEIYSIYEDESMVYLWEPEVILI